MKRSGITLDQAINSIFVSYSSVLKKKGIYSKQELKKKMLAYYSSGDLETHVKKISLDKFKTLLMRMVISTPNFDDIKPPEVATETEKNSLRNEVTKYVRKYLKELQPLPNEMSAQPQKELEKWEEDNQEDIREMFDNIIENFGVKAVNLGLDIDHIAIQSYHTVIEDEF